MVIQRTPVKIDKIVSFKIGQQQENAATQIRMNVTDWVTAHPNAGFHILFKRPGEVQAQPVLSSLISSSSGSYLTWTVGAWETEIIGVGYAEVRAVEADTALVAKSRVIPCSVEDSIIEDEGDVPPAFQGWVNGVLAAKDAAEASEQSAWEHQLGALDERERARQYAEAAQGAQSAAETAQSVAETAQGKAETAQSAAETAQSAAETAQGLAEGFKNQAIGYYNAAKLCAEHAETYKGQASFFKDQAEVFSQYASQHAQNAATSESNAATSASNAAQSAQAAQTDYSTLSAQVSAQSEVISGMGNSLGEFNALEASNNNSRNLYLEKSGTYTAGETIYVEPLKCNNGPTQYVPQYIYVYGFAGSSFTKLYQWDAPSLPQKGVNITLEQTYDKIRIAFRFEASTTATAAAILGRVSTANVAGRVLINEQRIPDYSELKINCLGDSLTYGYIPRLDDDHPATQMSPTWCEQLASDFGCTVRNYGMTNNCLANNSGGTGDPMCIRYATMDDDADIVIVMGGSNDFLRAPAALGTIDSVDNTTFYGAYNVLVQGLITKYLSRKTRIILMVPPMRSRSTEQNTYGTTLLQIQQAVRDIAHKYALPYVDWAYDAGISAYLISADNTQTYTYDSIHINQNIVLHWILPMIEDKIKAIIKS